MMKFTLFTVMLFALIASVFSWEEEKRDDNCAKEVHCDNVRFPNVCTELDYLTCVESNAHLYAPGTLTCYTSSYVPH